MDDSVLAIVARSDTANARRFTKSSTAPVPLITKSDIDTLRGEPQMTVPNQMRHWPYYRGSDDPWFDDHGFCR